MAKFSILNSHEDCSSCIKSYAKKHNFKKGDGFDISCRGIPKQYVSDAAASLMTGEMDAEMLLDPVKWAAEVLDWYCLDPDGSVWARKDPEEYHRMMAENPGRQSKYHRPYQATLLKCSSQFKVMRLGRRSGKSECIVLTILFKIFTQSQYRVVIITPYQSQINLIFKRIDDLLSGNPLLLNSIRRSVKAPNYSLELHNGSLVTGFSAGTKSKSGAGSARGSDAHLIVLDEADMLDRSDFDATLAIIADHPDALVIAASTPTGKRDKFYELTLDRGWKEFHHPSHVNPNWSETLDAMFKKNLSSIGYKQEILAELSEQESGVFQVAFVEQAIHDYKYSSCIPSNNWMYTIGVDWNSPKVGTTIYVTGFNPSTNKFMLVEQHTIQREGWTQTAACQKLIELNRKWKPVSMYVDKGYGHTCIEILHKYGYDARVDPDRGPNHIDSKLPKLIKAYDFGSTIETRDLFTKEIIKKPAKGFLVENGVRRFESGEILIPAEDEQLKKELLSYIIKHVTVTGQVVYTTIDEAIGDHRLDALLLSLVAFTLEKTPFGKPTLNEKIIFTSIDHDKKVPPSLLEGLPMPPEQKSPSSSRQELQSSNSTKPVKLWDWPGFGHDAPRPIKARQQSTNRTLLTKSSRPGKRSTF